MSGPTLTNTQVFGSMCGNKAMKCVVLATTMWDQVPIDKGMHREEELKEYWKPMLDGEAMLMRFENTYQSAWRIIDSIENKNGFDLDIQIQMENGNSFNQTGTGKTLGKARMTWLAIKRWFRSVVSLLTKQIITHQKADELHPRKKIRRC